MIPIKAWNISQHPVKITIAVTSSGINDEEILITVGPQEKSLKSMYGQNCLEQDLEPDKTWKHVGVIELQSKHSFKLKQESE